MSTATLSLLPALSASAVVGGPKAPGMLKVERTGASMTELAIAWKGAAYERRPLHSHGVQRQQGSLPGRGRQDHQTRRRRPGECTRWQVRVSATDADGNTASTNAYRVAPLAPGGVTAMDVDRTNDGKNGVVFWDAPRFPEPQPRPTRCS